jgi:phosphoribosyl 1,2-cyclic phosphodiesterase
LTLSCLDLNAISTHRVQRYEKPVLLLCQKAGCRRVRVMHHHPAMPYNTVATAARAFAVDRVIAGELEQVVLIPMLVGYEDLKVEESPGC